MPEYCEVEMIEQCNQQTFQIALDKLSTFFYQLGYEHSEFIPWLSQITWPSSDEGRSVYILKLPKMIVVNKLEPLACAGLEVLIERNTNLNSSDGGWLKSSLLFDAETIRDISTGMYRPEVGKTLWYLFQQLVDVFIEDGIYFTDEWQEGRTLWTIVGIKQEVNLWTFDLALVPKALISRFGITPEIFQHIALDDLVGFARGDRWTRLLWENG